MRLTANTCLLIIYTVGLLGMFSGYGSDFIKLTPFNLLASLAFLIWGEEAKSNKIWLGLAIGGTLGWLVEVIGTQQGWLFGAYTYGATLGPKILATPLTMFVNWAMLLYAVVGTLNFFMFSWEHGFCRRLQTALFGATLMVLLDLLIEPIAVRYDFWTWQDARAGEWLTAPIQNYVAWWGISFVLLFALQPLWLRVRNSAAPLLLGLQFLFFALLALT